MKNNKVRLAVLAALSCGKAVAGDIVFDGTLGAPGAAPFNTQTRTFSITPDRGRRAGDNLFHSFGTFNLSANETARFDPIGVFNILLRVTGIGSANGLQPSTLNGTLSAPGATVWFMNPAGIIVGNGAALDSSTTGLALGAADFVDFGTGSSGQPIRWTVSTNATATSLLTAFPSAFGFLPTSTATLRVEGSSPTQRVSITGTSGGFPPRIVLAGSGGVTLTNADFRTNNFAPLGRFINSITSNGPIVLNNSTFTSGGDLVNNAVRVQGDTVSLLNSSTVGAAARIAGDVTITATGSSSPLPSGAPGTPVLRVDSTSRVTTDGGGSAFIPEPNGNAGNITLRADTGPIAINGTISSTARLTAERGGQVTISGSDVILDGATVQTTTASELAETAPAIRVEATRATTITNTSIAASTSGVRPAGNIDISGQSVALSGSRTVISSETTGAGDAGSIRVTASGASGAGGQAALSINGGVQLRSAADATSATGDAGTIALAATSGAIAVNDGFLSTSAGRTAGAAGNITVSASGDVSFSGSTPSFGSQVTSTTAARVTAAPSTIALTSTNGTVRLADTFISGTTYGVNAAANVAIAGQSVEMTRSSVGTSTTYVTNQVDNNDGNAGNIVVTANGSAGGTGILLDSSSLTSQASRLTAQTGTAARTNAGSITLQANAGTVRIAGAGGATDTISTSAGVNAGQAGEISISAATVDVANATLSTTVDSRTAFTGVNAGRIAVTASGGITLTDARLNTTTSGAIKAGSISIDGSSVLMNGGQVSAATLGTADAGSIDLIARGASGTGGREALRLENGAAITSTATDASSTTTRGGAGTISLAATSGAVGIVASELSTSAGASARQAGSIAINAEQNLSLQGASVQTTVASANAAGATAAAVTLRSSGGAVTLTNSDLNATTTGAIRAGNISVTGQSIAIRGGQVTASSNGGSGSAGDIDIAATGVAGTSGQGSLTVDGNAVLSSTATSNDARAGAGAIRLSTSAGALSVIDAHLSTSASLNAGEAGSISLTSVGAGDVSLRNSDISTNIASQNVGGGPGEIAVSSNGGAVTLSNSELKATTSGAVRAGNVVLAGRSLTVQGGQITTSTTGSGAAGNVRLDARAGDLQVNGGAVIRSDALQGTSASASAGEIGLTSVGVTRIAGSTLSTSAGSAAGQAGSISIVSGQDLSLTDAALSTTVARSGAGLTAQQIAALRPAAVQLRSESGAVRLAGTTLDATTSGAVDAGDVTILGRTVELGRGTTISTSTISQGNGGDIGVAGNAVLIEGASLRSQATAAGNAGGICVAAGPAGCVTRSAGSSPRIAAALPPGGGITLQDSNLSTSTAGAGTAGNITLLGTGGLLLSGSTLQSSSTATANGGAGGSIMLTAGPADVFRLENSRIDTNAVSAAGGDITIDAGGNPLALQDSVIVASAGAAGNGGDITINNAADVVLASSGILAQAERGNGGAITINIINGGVFLQDSASLVSADSQQGINGAVSINAPNTDLNSALSPQDVDVSQPAELGSNACAPRGAGSRSTFVREGRGGVAETPDGYLISRNASSGQDAGRAQNSSSSDRFAAAAPATSSDRIVVDQGSQECF